MVTAMVTATTIDSTPQPAHYSPTLWKMKCVAPFWAEISSQRRFSGYFPFSRTLRMGILRILVACLFAAVAWGAPTPSASSSSVFIFDLTPTLTADPADAYEVVHTVAALQVGTSLVAVVCEGQLAAATRCQSCSVGSLHGLCPMQQAAYQGCYVCGFGDDASCVCACVRFVVGLCAFVSNVEHEHGQQGIVNRAAPQLLVNYTESDPYWLQYTMSRGFLSGQTLVPISDLGALVRQFASSVTGVVRACFAPTGPPAAQWVLAPQGACMDGQSCWHVLCVHDCEPGGLPTESLGP